MVMDIPLKRSFLTVGRADQEFQRQAREQAERRSEEVVRMAQEHYFPWRPEW